MLPWGSPPCGPAWYRLHFREAQVGYGYGYGYEQTGPETCLPACKGFCRPPFMGATTMKTHRQQALAVRVGEAPARLPRPTKQQHTAGYALGTHTHTKTTKQRDAAQHSHIATKQIIAAEGGARLGCACMWQ